MTHIDDMVAFVREELGAAELASAREHLAVCGECRAEADALRAVFGAVASTSVEPSVGFAGRVAAEARKIESARRALRETEIEAPSNFPWRVASAAHSQKTAPAARRGVWGRMAWIATRPVFGYPAWSVSAAVHLVACGVMALVAVDRVEARKERMSAKMDLSHRVQIESGRPADRYTRRPGGEFTRTLERRSDAAWRAERLQACGMQGTDAAVEGALDWLAGSQQADGSWNPDSGSDAGRAGATGLAILAFLGRGYSPSEGKHASTLRQGLDWLTAQQTLTGRFGGDTGGARPQHAIATAAVAEAYLLTGDPELGGALANATAYAAASRSPRGGWGAALGGTPDAVTTAWTMLALQLAHAAGIESARPSLDAGNAYLESLTDTSGRTTLRTPGDPRADSSLATAAALAARRRNGLGAEDAARRARLVEVPGSPDGAATCLAAMATVDSPAWAELQPKLTAAVLARREASGGFGGVEETALAVLTLETPYRAPGA